MLAHADNAVSTMRQMLRNLQAMRSNVEVIGATTDSKATCDASRAFEYTAKLGVSRAAYASGAIMIAGRA
jgi:hypothetical protein